MVYKMTAIPDAAPSMGHQSGRWYMLGHWSPMMVRRYSATYDSEQAARPTLSSALRLPSN